MSLQIVTRATWGSRYDDGAGPAPLPAPDGLFLHHSDGPFSNGPEVVRALEAVGEARFGAGISYTFVVTPDGTCYQGHSIDRLGSHTKGHNTAGRAVVLAGDYTSQPPTPAQRETVAQLLAHGVRSGWWPTTRLRGHRDVRPTECPGTAAYAAIGSIIARADQLLTAPPLQEDDDMPTTAELVAALTPAIRRVVAEELKAAMGPTSKLDLPSNVRTLERHLVHGAGAARGAVPWPERVTDSLARLESGVAQLNERG